MDSLLICIGIDNFQDKTIEKLIYCEADCCRMLRTFNVFNIVDEAIKLINSEATQDYILKVLKNIPKALKTLYVYFSTHGEYIDGHSYLYTYDTEAKRISKTSLALNLLVEILVSFAIEKTVLIIDACHVKVPENINDSFTIISPETNIIHEDTFLKQSSFTKKLLDTFTHDYQSNWSNRKNNRYQRIRQSIAKLLQGQDLINIQGKSGLGKSYLLKEIKKSEEHTFYVSIPRLEGITVEVVLSLLNEEIANSSIDDYLNPIDAKPERYIRFYTTLHPHSLIIIDHFDHLKAETAHQVIEFLKELPASKIVASRQMLGIIPEKSVYSFPLLTDEDIIEFFGEERDIEVLRQSISNHDNYIDIFEQIYQHNHQELLKEDETHENIITRKALAVTGGYITPKFFVEIFGISQKTLTHLTEMGLITFYEDFYYPHDAIYEGDFFETEINQLQNLSLAYWIKEIKSAPNSTKSAQNFVLLLVAFSLELDNNDLGVYMAVISALKGRQNTHFLISLYDYFKKKNIPEILRLYLSEALIEIGKFDEAFNVLLLDKTSITLEALKAELYWWQGKFQECVETSTLLLASTNEENCNLHLHCARGIGYFFLGQWESSSADLLLVIKKAPKHLSKLLYFSYCVLATIQGLRGTDFSASVNHFIHAISLAKRSGKLAWIALVYGNVGEILWKASFFEKSIEILVTSSHLAYLTDNEPLYLEINRNLLHAYHRNNQLNEFKNQLKKIESIFENAYDNYVRMQIVNTLVTHYIFVGDKKYQLLLFEAKKLTQNNNEYQIYTLSNIALVEMLSEVHNEFALTTMKEALNLGIRGKNWLAIKQCLEDWDRVIQLYELDYPRSKQAFQKWHQVLEKELLPNLHYLSNLCEYLEHL